MNWDWKSKREARIYQLYTIVVSIHAMININQPLNPVMLKHLTPGYHKQLVSKIAVEPRCPII